MGIISDIKKMKVQGASQIALFGLEYLKKISKKHGFGTKFNRASRELINARPTAVVMYNVVDKARKIKDIDAVIFELINSREDVSKKGSKIFKKKSIVMTHCHSHEVVSLLIANKTKIKKVIVTETRPVYQGKKTAKDLVMAGIKVDYIIDSAVGYFMNDVDMIVVGSDALRKEGNVNKIGTLPLSITAKEFRKPVYVVADTFKLDRRKKLEIEERGVAEVALLRSVRVRNPAFDITPWKYVTAVVTEKGVMKPSRIKDLIRK